MVGNGEGMRQTDRGRLQSSRSRYFAVCGQLIFIIALCQINDYRGQRPAQLLASQVCYGPWEDLNLRRPRRHGEKPGHKERAHGRISKCASAEIEYIFIKSNLQLKKREGSLQYSATWCLVRVSCSFPRSTVEARSENALKIA